MKQARRKKKIRLTDIDVVMSHWDSDRKVPFVTRQDLIERCKTLTNLNHLLLVRYDEEEDALYFSAIPEVIYV